MRKLRGHIRIYFACFLGLLLHGCVPGNQPIVDELENVNASVGKRVDQSNQNIRETREEIGNMNQNLGRFINVMDERGREASQAIQVVEKGGRDFSELKESVEGLKEDFGEMQEDFGEASQATVLVMNRILDLMDDGQINRIFALMDKLDTIDAALTEIFPYIPTLAIYLGQLGQSFERMGLDQVPPEKIATYVELMERFGSLIGNLLEDPEFRAELEAIEANQPQFKSNMIAIMRMAQEQDLEKKITEAEDLLEWGKKAKDSKVGRWFMGGGENSEKNENSVDEED